jgi:hypothetical protein
VTTGVAVVALVLSMLKASVGVGRSGMARRCANLILSTNLESR